MKENERINEVRKGHEKKINVGKLSLFIIMLVAFLSLLSLAGYEFFKRAVVDMNTIHIREIAAHDISIINSKAEERLDLLTNMAEDILYWNEKDGTSPTAVLHSDAAFIKKSDKIFLVSENGTICSSNNVIERRLDILDVCLRHDERFVERFENVADILPEFHREYVMYGVKIAPVVNESTTYEYLCCFIRPSELEEELRMESYGGQGLSSIIDTDGNYLLNTNRNHSILERNNFFGNFESVRGYDSVEQFREKLAVASNTDVTVRAVAKSVSGQSQEYYVVFTPMDGREWIYVSLIPASVLDEQSAKLMHISGALLGVFAVVAAAGIVFYYRSRKQQIMLREKKATDELNEKLQEKQAELETALDQAQSSNRAKTVFLSSMSHDIRTPMNAIIGYTGMAARQIDNKEKVNDYLSKINQSSQHLLSLINDVLDMSRIESGKVSINAKDESLTEIVESISDIIHEEANKKKIDVSVDCDVQNDYVKCDKLRLNQILINILSNAIKYTQAGGAVVFNLKEKGLTPTGCGRYEFCIRDNGMGMSEEFLKVIYEPFTRVNTSTVSGIQGTGLGMAITKNLVELMKGTIDIQSREGEGTEIVLNFEFRISQDKRKEENTTEYDFTGKKILLVDDNEMNREIATDILGEAGFIVDTADDGIEAVEKMKSAKPGQYDAILMDVQMPIMNGYDATRNIRNLPDSEIANITIIAMTANAFEEDRREAIKAGMNEHLAKPIVIPKLKATLAKYLNR